jgi:hypothetical protein
VAGLNASPAESVGPEIAALDAALRRCHHAVTDGLPRTRCLRRWSEFIRLRDGQRCVDCHSSERLSAHHICRKTFFEQAQFETGNGITLCHDCHRGAHRGFNGRPDLAMPADAQGGEKLATIERFYSILLDDAIERGLLREDYYFLSDAVLGSFKRMQGYDTATVFPGSRLEQAYLIVAEPERQLRNAIAQANGFTLGNGPLLPGGAAIIWDHGEGTADVKIFRGYSTRSR